MVTNEFVVKNTTSYLKNLPHLNETFCATFESIFVTTEDLTLHAVRGGNGPAILLLGGWPQTWYTWRFVMPELVKDYSVIAVDPRGSGLSDKPYDGYDSATLATDMVKLMGKLGYEKFAMVGFDIGMWTGYALASDYPEKLHSIVVADAIIPGISLSPPIFGNAWLTNFLWHFSFNRLPKVNELLVTGREEIYFEDQFRVKGASPEAIPQYALDVYINSIKASPEALTASFNYYRAIDLIMEQNAERKKTKLKLPVLAVGGAQACAQGVETEMQLVAENVTGLVLSNCGHYVPEEAPETFVSALKNFFAPYKASFDIN